MTKAMLGIAALLPMITGPVIEEETSLLIELCSGSQISIPLGDDGEEHHPCDPQACHAGTCREKLKTKN